MGVAEIILNEKKRHNIEREAQGVEFENNWRKKNEYDPNKQEILKKLIKIK